MNKRYLRNLFIELKPPLGVGAHASENILARKLVQIDLREDKHKCIYFNEVFYEVMKLAYGNVFKDSKNTKLLKSMLQRE